MTKLIVQYSIGNVHPPCVKKIINLLFWTLIKFKISTKKKVLFTILFSVSLLANTNAKKIGQPNVVFIMIDDLGWKDVGFMGSTFYETPNVDALAKNGMLFMNAYTASPLCSATRASIMSGTWPARNGLTSAAGHLKETTYKSTLEQKADSKLKAIQAKSASRINPEYFTMAEAFKEGGYTTAHIGKWHIGDEPSDPLSQGFDVEYHTPMRQVLCPKVGSLHGQFGKDKEKKETTWKTEWLRTR